MQSELHCQAYKLYPSKGALCITLYGRHFILNFGKKCKWNLLKNANRTITLPKNVIHVFLKNSWLYVKKNSAV